MNNNVGLYRSDPNPIPIQTIPPNSQRVTATTNDNSSNRPQEDNTERSTPTVEYPDNNLPEQYRISIRFGKVEKGMRNIPSPISHLLFFLNRWETLNPDIHPVFNIGTYKGKICPAQMFPSNPRDVRIRMHTVYSRRVTKPVYK